MAGTVGFRWLDILENEFDKSVLELDRLLGDMDEDEADVVDQARLRMTNICSAFSQLVHKSLTVFQNNAKLEAQVIYLRDELSDARSHTQGDVGPSPEPDQVGDNQSSATLAKINKKLECKLKLIDEENDSLRKVVLTLQSEIAGARLATKYLDKELAGRIQQLQILTSEGMKPEMQRKVWGHLESEIFLQRHKTVIRACQEGLEVTNEPSEATTDRHTPMSNGNRDPMLNSSQGKQSQVSPASQPLGVRKLLIKRGETEGLGISITGGQEYGLPILISKVHKDTPAARSGGLFVGDSILSVNGSNLREITHSNAVQLLTSLRGDLEMEVMSAPTEWATLVGEQSIKPEDDRIRYPIHTEEVGGDSEPQHVSTIVELSQTRQSIPTPEDTSNSMQNLNIEDGKTVTNVGVANKTSDQSEKADHEGNGQTIVRIGKYEMANIQSLNNEADDACFNSSA